MKTWIADKMSRSASQSSGSVGLSSTVPPFSPHACRDNRYFCKWLPTGLVVLALAGNATAAVKPNASWTVAQARIALLTTARIWGADYTKVALGVPDGYREWVMSVQQVNVLRPDGPAVTVKGRRTWRQFVVNVTGLNALSGTPLRASFCLHVAGAVRTTYPYSQYTLTGFFAGPAWVTKLGCTDSPTARKYNGGVDR